MKCLYCITKALEKRKKPAISDDEEEEEEGEEDAEGPGLEALVVPSPAVESSDEDESPSKRYLTITRHR